ncbi:MAG: sel1 repeat family protein [Lachnospiraceae bacterium]|nr:sel1 repeat family protein [Lachnospiraceae bacterium]
MGKRKFGPKDWAVIKYGDRAGDYCKITMLDKEGRYVVIPYGKDNEPGEMMTLSARAMDRLPALMITKEELQRLVSARTMYRDYADKVFPPFNIRAQESYEMTASDIRDALLYIGGRGNCLEDFKEWFWVIINVFYDDLGIKERYREDFFSDCPENDDEMFSVAYSLVEKLYWKLEERFSQKEYFDNFIIKFRDPVDWDEGKAKKHIEEAGYKVVSDDIVSRVNVYEYNRTRPREKRIYSSSEKKHIVSGYDSKESFEKATPEELEQYRTFVEDLYNEGDPMAIKTLAWGYFEGTGAFTKDLALSKRYLEEFFAKTGDPYAANALGYICYYGFANGSLPEYKDAFKYFAYGAMAGVDESIYRAADMLLAGKGTVKNIDMGLNLIVDGYRDSFNDFCWGHYDNMFPEYALRMGNACRDDLIYGMNLRDAYKFYLEAKLAVKMRKEKGGRPGDIATEGKVDHEIQRIRKRLDLDIKQTTIRTDFPLYLSQLFEDKFPVKVELNVSKDGKSGTLKVSRFRFGKEMAEEAGFMPEGSEAERWFKVPGMIVAYPELSYAEMVTELTYTLEGVVVATKTEQGPFFLAEAFRKNEQTNALEFYAYGKLAAAIDAQWYVITVDKEPESGKDKISE